MNIKELAIVLSLEEKDFGKFYILSQEKEFSQSIWKADRPEESVMDSYKRVAKAAASIENDEEKEKKWRNSFIEEMKHKRIQPAGRIMTAANVGEGYTKNLTLYNCYVIPSPKSAVRPKSLKTVLIIQNLEHWVYIMQEQIV